MPLEYERPAEEAFDSTEPDKAVQYLGWMRETIAGYYDHIRRNIILMLILVVSFELLYHSAASQFQLGSFRVYRGSVIFLFIPPLVSYLYLDVLLNSFKLKRITIAFYAVFRRWSPRAESSGLATYLIPVRPLYWIAPGGLRQGDPGRFFNDRVEGAGSAILFSFIFLGMLVFEVQSFYVLFNVEHVSNVIFWLSAAFAIACLLFSFVFAFFEDTDPSWRSWLPVRGD